MSDVKYFIPAVFDLYEFDDGRMNSEATAGRRWFSGFNGLVGAPAQDVTLGWSDNHATAVVCTSGRRPRDQADARATAAHVALGGNQLPIPSRPSSAAETTAAIQRIAVADGLWSYIPGILPNSLDAETIIWDGFTLAYIYLTNGALFIAAIRINPAQLLVRKVQNWNSYDHDATKSFPLTAPRG